MGCIEEVQGPLLAALSESHDLVWRDYRVRVTLAPNPGGAPVIAKFTLPSRVPFLIVNMAYSSIRPYDGQIVDTTFRSRERTYVDETETLELLCNRVSAGGEPANLPPMFFYGNEELIWTFERLFPVDPAEAYPGAGQDSIITLRIRGAEVWPKGSQITDLDFAGLNNGGRPRPGAPVQQRGQGQ